METYTFLKDRKDNKWYSLKKFDFSDQTKKSGNEGVIHKNKIKNIKIHSYRFEREYTRTQEHGPKSQELKNTKFLGIQHLSQKISPYTEKIHI